MTPWVVDAAREPMAPHHFVNNRTSAIATCNKIWEILLYFGIRKKARVATLTVLSIMP
jgi:hypothetical protein